MKKLFILIAFISITKSSTAQFGFTAGATYATPDPQKYNSKIGLTIGTFYNYPISTDFIFMPGLNYTQKGGQFTVSSPGFKREFSTTLHYLELLLNFKYKLPDGFSIGAGPSIAYVFYGKDKTTISQSTTPGITNGTTVDILKFGNDKFKNDFKAFEFGIDLTAGYAVTKKIFINLSYNMGLSNISLYPDKEKYKNRYLAIKIGYVLNK